MSSRVVYLEVDTQFLEKGMKKMIWKWEWLERKVNGELIWRFITKINIKRLVYYEQFRNDGREWKSIFPVP
jgi:hypothetical protein